MHGVPHEPDAPRPTLWSRRRKLVRRGFKDLEYLPRSHPGWDATLAAHASSARRRLVGRADLNLWAAMQNCAPSGRYSELGEEAIVLWHGTTRRRAERIREHGLAHKRGVWATLEPRIAHRFSRGRGENYRARPATIVLVLDRREARPGSDYELETDEVARFHQDLPPEWIEFILWDDDVEFVGARPADSPSPWGTARFKKREGEWVPLSKPPVRLDAERSYCTLAEWLDQSVRRILETLAAAAAIEVFSSLYSTIDPWDALSHDEVFAALEGLCAEPRTRRGLKTFSLQASP
jgi:hypothetical protein